MSDEKVAGEVAEGAPRDWPEQLRAILKRYPDAIFVVPTLFDELQELLGRAAGREDPMKLRPLTKYRMFVNRLGHPDVTRENVDHPYVGRLVYLASEVEAQIEAIGQHWMESQQSLIDTINEVEATVATLQQELNRVDSKEDLLRGQIADLARAIAPNEPGPFTIPELVTLATAHREQAGQAAGARGGVSPQAELERCPARAPFDEHNGQCGLEKGHDGEHTLMIPTNAPWVHE